jgi:hypothetical protein
MKRKNMKHLLLAIAFSICLLTHTSIAQVVTPNTTAGFSSDIAAIMQQKRCPQIPPYTEMITTNSDSDIDFIVRRGQIGYNGFIFNRNGFLTYCGLDFTPSIFAASYSSEFVVSFRSFNPVMALAWPKQNPSDSTPVFLLNGKNLSSRKIIAGLSGVSKAFWSPSHKYALILCDSKGQRFVLVNAATGTTSKGITLKNGRNLLYLTPLYNGDNGLFWTDKDNRVILTVKEVCNPYEDRGCDPNHVLAKYRINFDVAAMRLSTKITSQ